MPLTASTLSPEAAVFRHVIPAGEPYLHEIKAGQTLRLLDLEGNQAIDTLFYSASNPRERYDPQRTLRRQNKAYLTSGTVLYSNLGRPMLTIVADTCGRHDTLGGACAQESNTVRYSLAHATCTAAATTSCAPACTTAASTSVTSAPTSTSS
jgi:uncharacterized protein YcgI (DUF1989 family)